MMAAAVIEQRMIGHISGPPARTISHIQVTSYPLGKTAASDFAGHQPRFRRQRTQPLPAAHHTGGARPLKAAAQLRSRPRGGVTTFRPPASAVCYSQALHAAPAFETTCPGPERTAGALVSATLRGAPQRSAAV